MSADHTELQGALEVVRSDLQHGFCAIADIKALRDACQLAVDEWEADVRAHVAAIFRTSEAPHAGQQ